MRSAIRRGCKQNTGVRIRRLMIDFRWVMLMGKEKDRFPDLFFVPIILKYLFIFGHVRS